MSAIVVIAAGLIASLIDVRTRRVPNLLTMPLACVGLLLAATGLGSIGPTEALLGLIVGLGIMLPLHVLGGTGAGDVKLMAAFGALLGPAGVLGAFIRMALIGGVFALIVARQRGRLRETINGTALLVARVDGVAAALEQPAVNNKFPYAPAVAIGAALVVLGW